MITVHVFLLACAIALPPLMILSDPGRPGRSITSLASAIWPFLAIGVVSALTLSAHGTPGVEWVVPTLGLVATWACCRSEATSRAARSGLLMLAILLLCTWARLVPPGLYTSRPETTASMSRRSSRPPRPVAEWHTPITRLYRVRRDG